MGSSENIFVSLTRKKGGIQIEGTIIIFSTALTIAVVFMAIYALICMLIGILTEKRRIVQGEAEQMAKIKQEEQRKKDAILRFPVKELTQTEFEQLLKGENLPEGFLNTCPIGTWFVCVKSDFVPDIIVVGQVVRDNDLICEQWGAGLCIPERGINRYRVKIIDPAENKTEVTVVVT